MPEHDFIEEEDADLYEHHRFVADKGQQLLRVDKFLLHKIPNASRNRIQTAIELGTVKVNEQNTKNSYRIKPSDVVTVHLPNPPRNEEIFAENIPLEIVYEDDDLLLVNKPAGMVVHPAHGNWNGTLVNALLHHFEELPQLAGNETPRPGLVHRIDKDTSGLLLIAKTEYAMSFLWKQFFDHSIERTYYALVWGEPKEPRGTIRGHIGRSTKDRKVMDVYPDGSVGKHAVTHYEVVKALRYVSLVRCNLETGRSHQIRAHFQHIGHPLFSDAAYGGDKILRGTTSGAYRSFVQNAFELCPRQALHAQSLGFVHPKTKEWVQFESPIPPDMQALINKWESYINFM